MYLQTQNFPQLAKSSNMTVSRFWIYRHLNKVNYSQLPRMTLTNRIFRNISILLAVMLLTVSLDSSVPIQAQGQIGVDEGMDWTHVNYDVFASNFNPQRKINSDNIGEMQIKWVFPIPRPEEPRLGGYNIRGQGEDSTPLINNGKV